MCSGYGVFVKGHALPGESCVTPCFYFGFEIKSIIGTAIAIYPGTIYFGTLPLIVKDDNEYLISR